MGLRGKIFLGVLAAYILLVALVQLYFGNAIRAVLIQNADGFAANGFAQTRRGVERLVEQVAGAANLICFNEKIAEKINRLDAADSWTRYEDVTFINQELRSARNILLGGYAADLYLICDGGMISNSNYQSMAPVAYDELIQSEWYRSGVPYGRGRWLTPTADHFTAGDNQDRFFTLVQSIWGETTYSGYRGALILNIREKDSFGNLLAAARMNADMDFYLLSGDGRVISSTDGIADGAADRGLSDLPFGAALAERLDGGTGAPFQYQGGAGAVHVSYAPVAGTDWVLVETLPYADLIGGANAIQRRFFYMVTAIAMLSAAGAMAFMGRLVKPIRSMAEAAREIAHGQFDRRLGIRRGDEVGALAASFDAMCDDMERLLKRLSEENELRNRLNLEMLRAQLEPHFLFNALGSIKSMANLSGNPVIAQMVTNLAFMLESALGKNGEFTTLGEELSFTEHYVALQRVRFNDFEFDACVDEEALPCVVPRMILQPLIENSLKHGFLNNPVGGVVRLRARRDGDALRIEIADNGAGMDADRVRELLEGGDGAKCVGLSNIRRRLAIYYGDAPRPCGGRYGLSISSQPGRGTAVALSIPFDGKEGATC